MPRTRVPFTELSAVYAPREHLDAIEAEVYLGASLVWHRDPDTDLLVTLYGLHRPDGGPLQAYVMHEPLPHEPPPPTPEGGEQVVPAEQLPLYVGRRISFSYGGRLTEGGLAAASTGPSGTIVRVDGVDRYVPHALPVTVHP